MKLTVWQVMLVVLLYFGLAAHQLWELIQLEQGAVDEVLLWAPLVGIYKAYGKFPVALIVSLPGWFFAYVLYRVYVHGDVRQ